MKYLNVVRIALAAAGAGGILAGMLLGQDQETLRKAVMICLECIGIG